MSDLSDKELEQAAAEAGISAGELRAALARRESGDAVETTSKPSKVKSHGFVQARVAAPPSQALSRVHRTFNQQIGFVPVRGEDGSIRYVAEETGLTYHLSSESDGTPSGAIVRADVDLSVVIRRVQKRIVPFVGVLALLALAIGHGLGYLLLAGILPTIFIMWVTTKHRVLKEAKQTGQAVLDRVSQGALPER